MTSIKSFTKSIIISQWIITIKIFKNISRLYTSSVSFYKNLFLFLIFLVKRFFHLWHRFKIILSHVPCVHLEPGNEEFHKIHKMKPRGSLTHLRNTKASTSHYKERRQLKSVEMYVVIYQQLLYTSECMQTICGCSLLKHAAAWFYSSGVISQQLYKIRW